MAGFQHKTVGTSITQAEYEQTNTGHQFASQATGMMLYSSSSTVNTSLAIGSTNTTLQVVGGVPSWVTSPLLPDDLSLVSDSAIFKMGAGSDFTITHDGTTGATLAGNPITITAGGASTWSTSAGALTITAGAALNLNPTSGSAVLIDGTISIDAGVLTGATAITSATIDATTDFTIGDTVITDGVVTDSSGLSLAAATTVSGTLTVGVDDSGFDVKLFGAAAGAYMLWDEDANLLDIRGATAAGPGHLKLTTGELTVVNTDVLGQIDFQAPAETGTDAITVAAKIAAVAQDTFAAAVNATDLIFYTGHSEAATEKFRFTSQGELGIGGANYGTDGQVFTSAGAGAAPAWEAVPAGGISTTLADGNILVGNGSNVATSVNPSGDVDVSNAGVFTIDTDLKIFCWINFDGRGSITIDDSFNVADITDNSVGNYHVNYTVDANTVEHTARASNGMGWVDHFITWTRQDMETGASQVVCVETGIGASTFGTYADEGHISLMMVQGD